MHTWAVVRDSSDEIGIWKYCTTKKDIAPYFYIKDAINKYGWDDIMPCIVNCRGGYTSAKGMEILDIITCEATPTLEDLQRYIKNEPKFNCGWISPNGDTYSCHHYGHTSLAQDICDFIYQETYRNYRLQPNSINAPDDFLLNIGWIKIDSSHNHYGIWTNDNEGAAKKLDELQQKWSVK